MAAKTFEEYMRENGLSAGYGPGYLYSKDGGAHDRGAIIRNWQQEQGGDTISSLLSGLGQGSNGPTMPQDNRFSAGLSDAESRLRALLENPDSINQSAAYKFRVGQGQEALQRSLGAKGLLNSGNRLMELTKYGQDMGSQEYDNQYGRLSSLLGNYSQGYLGDKNANTAQFSAEAGARANAERNALGRASLAWDMQKQAPITRTISSMSGGMGQPANLGAIGGYQQAQPSAVDNPWAEDGRTVDGRTIYRNSNTGMLGFRG